MEKIVGVIYSDEERKAYCIENSYYHKNNLNNRQELKVIDVSSSSILPIFLSNWSLEKILSLGVERQQ